MTTGWDVVAQHRDYRYLLGAGLISLSGDWVLQVGLAYYVYAVSGSTLASAVVLLAAYLPQLALGSVAGVFVDRWEHRRTMIATDVAMASCLVPLFWADEDARLWIVYLVVAAQSCLAQFFQPAESALLPRLVPPADLVAANALNSQNRDIARLLGAAVGGLALSLGGIAALVGIDAGSFLLAAALLTCIAARSRDATVPTATATSWTHQWRDGVALARRSRELRVLIVVAAITALGEGIMGTLFAPFIRTVLHGTGSVYGTVVAVQAIGGIVGATVVTSLSHKTSARRMLGYGAIGFGMLDLALFLYPLASTTLWPAFILMVLVGVPGAAAVAGLMTIFQTATTDTHRGRLFGALNSVEAVALVASTLAAGALGTSLGIVPTISVQAIGYLAAGAITFTLLPQRPAVTESTARTDKMTIPA